MSFHDRTMHPPVPLDSIPTHRFIAACDGEPSTRAAEAAAAVAAAREQLALEQAGASESKSSDEVISE